MLTSPLMLLLKLVHSRTIALVEKMLTSLLLLLKLVLSRPTALVGKC